MTSSPILETTNIISTYNQIIPIQYWLCKIFHMFSFLTRLKCGFIHGLTFKPAFLTCFCIMVLWFLSMCITSQCPPFEYASPLPICLPLSPTYQQASFLLSKSCSKTSLPSLSKSKFMVHYSLHPHTIILFYLIKE